MHSEPTWIENLDDEQTAQIHALMKNEWWCSDRTLDDVRQVLANSSLATAAIDEAGCVIGFARVLTDYCFKALVFDVIVHPDSRKHGLGKQLMTHLLNHPQLLRVRSMELYCPERMSGFYQKLGFTLSTSNLHRYERSL